MEKNKKKSNVKVGFAIGFSLLGILVAVATPIVLNSGVIKTRHTLDVHCNNCYANGATSLHEEHCDDEVVKLVLQADRLHQLPSDVVVMAGPHRLTREVDYDYSNVTGELFCRTKENLDVTINAVSSKYIALTYRSPGTEQSVGFSFTGEFTGEVDWGDGTIDTNNAHIFGEAPAGTEYQILIDKCDAIKSFRLTKDYYEPLYPGNKFITRMDLSCNIETIEYGAFYNCGLENVELNCPYLSTIDSYSFAHCRSLAYIYIPNNVNYIGYDAFYYCYSLVIFCASGSKPSNWSYYWNESGRPVYWGNSMKIEKEGVIYALTMYNDTKVLAVAKLNTASENVHIQESIELNGETLPVAVIGDHSLHCGQFASLAIPNSVKKIGSYAFENCSQFKSFEISSNIEELGSYAFASSSIETITFAANSQLKTIGYYAFYNCSSLTSITIPASVTSIDSYAFYNCSSLQTVTFEEGSQLKTIGYSAFQNCSSLTSITIPASVTSIESSAFYGCSSLTSIVVEAGNTKYDSRDNCNAIIETSTNKLIVGCKNTTIPSSVTSIGDYAFSGSNFTSFTVTSNITSIGNRAFQNCSSLKTVTFEEDSQLTSLGEFAFSFCEQMESINLEETKITSVPYECFWDCYKLTSVKVPSTVTSINSYAFEYCSSLATLDLSSSNRVISLLSTSAFSGCYNLQKIIVPADLVDSYKSASNWSSYSSKIVAPE